MKPPTQMELLKARNGMPWKCLNCASSISLRAAVSKAHCTCVKSEERRREVVAWLKEQDRLVVFNHLEHDV